jgi:hypothetical protein
MIDRQRFISVVKEKIAEAKAKQVDVNNPLDMRLYINNECSADIYGVGIDSIYMLYDRVKNEKCGWYVDFFENYNTDDICCWFAEFIDVVMWKEDVLPISNPFARWKKASENAITLWNQPYEEVKVEITSKYVKFFRRDDILSCYTYPPLHEMKKDKKCIDALKDTMYEACMWEELKAMKVWEENDCDMPPFPISVIFHSDYQNYDFEEWDCYEW